MRNIILAAIAALIFSASASAKADEWATWVASLTKVKSEIGQRVAVVNGLQAKLCPQQIDDPTKHACDASLGSVVAEFLAQIAEQEAQIALAKLAPGKKSSLLAILPSGVDRDEMTRKTVERANKLIAFFKDQMQSSMLERK